MKKIIILIFVNILIIYSVFYIGKNVKVYNTNDKESLDRFFYNKIKKNNILFSAYYNSYFYNEVFFDGNPLTQIYKSKNKIQLPNKYLNDLILKYIIELKSTNKIDNIKQQHLKILSLNKNNRIEFDLKTYNELEKYYNSSQFKEDFINSTKKIYSLKTANEHLNYRKKIVEHNFNIINTNSKKIIFEIIYFSIILWLFYFSQTKIQTKIIKILSFTFVLYIFLIPYLFFNYGMLGDKWSNEIGFPEYSTFLISWDNFPYHFGNAIIYRCIVGILFVPITIPYHIFCEICNMDINEVNTFTFISIILIFYTVVYIILKRFISLQWGLQQLKQKKSSVV